MLLPTTEGARHRWLFHGNGCKNSSPPAPSSPRGPISQQQPQALLRHGGRGGGHPELATPEGRPPKRMRKARGSEEPPHTQQEQTPGQPSPSGSAAPPRPQPPLQEFHANAPPRTSSESPPPQVTPGGALGRPPPPPSVSTSFPSLGAASLRYDLLFSASFPSLALLSSEPLPRPPSSEPLPSAQTSIPSLLPQPRPPSLAAWTS